MTAKAKLKDDQIIEIRDRAEKEGTNFNASQVGKEYGVDRSTISRVVNKKTFSDETVIPANTNNLIQAIPFHKISISPLNPRKFFDPVPLDELAESLLNEHKRTDIDAGILQNLIVRPKDDGTFEIVSGERRYRAVGINIEKNGWSETVCLPCRVHPYSDEEALEIAMVENIDRDDLTALEESQGFIDLYKIRTTLRPNHTQRQFALEMSNTMGCSIKHIERRMSLITKLGDKAQAALSKNTINVTQARTLTMTDDHAEQEAIIEEITEGWVTSPEEIRDRITDDLPQIDWALFDLKDYDGVIQRDPDDPDNPDVGWFVDTAQAEELQKAAIQTKIDELEATYAWVITIPANEYFYHHKYKDMDPIDPTKCGAVVELIRGFSMEIHEGLIKIEEAKSQAKSEQASPTEPEPVEFYTKAHLIHATNKRNEALQGAVGKDPRTAKVLMCLSLMGGRDSVLLSGENGNTDDQTASPEIIKTLDSLRPLFKGTLDQKRDANSVAFNKGWQTKDRDLYRIIRDLKDETLDMLLANLVAPHVGSFIGYYPKPGDTELVCELANDLKLTGNEHTLDMTLTAEDLAGLKKPALLRICQDLGVEPGKTLTKTREALIDHYGNPNNKDYYVCPTVRFGNEDDVKLAITPAVIDNDLKDEKAVA